MRSLRKQQRRERDSQHAQQLGTQTEGPARHLHTPSLHSPDEPLAAASSAEASGAAASSAATSAVAVPSGPPADASALLPPAADVSASVAGTPGPRVSAPAAPVSSWRIGRALLWQCVQQFAAVHRRTFGRPYTLFPDQHAALLEAVQQRVLQETGQGTAAVDAAASGDAAVAAAAAVEASAHAPSGAAAKDAAEQRNLILSFMRRGPQSWHDRSRARAQPRTRRSGGRRGVRACVCALALGLA